MRERLSILLEFLLERVTGMREGLGILLERVTGSRERPGSPSVRAAGTRGRLSILGLVAFVLVDVVLVVVAVRHTNATPPPAELAEATGQNPDAKDTDAEGAGTKPRQRETVAMQPLYTSLASDGSYLRATRGDCESGVQPVVEVSTDGGQSLSVQTIPGLTEVLRVQADRAANLYLVGTNRACDVLIYGTGDGGESWDESSGADGLWYLARDDSAAGIHAPDLGVVDAPCTPISLSTIDDGVLRALCDDGAIIATEDGGSTWARLGLLENAVAIGFTSAGDGYAVARRPGCRGAIMLTDDGGRSWARLACPGKGQARSIASGEGVIAAQIGDDLQVSSDGGSNWRVL